MQLVLGPRFIASSRNLARVLREGKAERQTREEFAMLLSPAPFPVRLGPIEVRDRAPCLFGQEADDLSHG